MAIELNCGHCGKSLRVSDQYAGRRARCPGCQQMLTIPDPKAAAEAPIFDDADDGAGGYALDLPPAQSGPAGLRSYDPSSAAAAPTLGPSAMPDPRFHPIRNRDGEEDKVPFYRAELISIAGVAITPLRVVVPLLLVGLPLLWFMLGPGKDAYIHAAEAVYVVEVLDHGDVQAPYNLYTGSGNMALGTTSSGPQNPASSLVYSLGGGDELLVTKPDQDGDFVHLDLSLKQGTLSNLGLISGYDTHIDADAFELRMSGDDPGTGVKGRLLTHDFTQSAEVDLSIARTTDYHALLPPGVKPDRLDVEESPGMVSGEAEYRLGTVKGSLEFSASRSTTDMPASDGLYASGRLTMTHPKGGPRVDADYEGGTLEATWDAQSQGHWARHRLTSTTKATPFERYEIGLLFPRPPGSDDGGKFTLSLAGRDIATFKLGRRKQPSAPAPSPIKSRQPGGPQAAAKTATGPMAYFDVLRDARSQAQGIVSANNLRQLGIGLQLYVQQNNRFPDSLIDLEPFVGSLEQLMMNPRTKENPGFIYVKPPDGANPANTPVIHESFQGQPDPNGATLYGDGSIR